MLVRPQVLHPGVYVSEVSDGPTDIVGVATSITAFVGRTVRGPVHRAVPVDSVPAFEARFGGLQADCPLTYCVRDFFQAGGRQALIVRLGQGTPATLTLASADPGGLVLTAAGPGAWGDSLRVRVAHPAPAELPPEALAAAGLSAEALFDLHVTLVDGLGQPIQQEVHKLVTLQPGTHRTLARVLADSALLSDAVTATGTARPADGAQASGVGGAQADALTLADYVTDAPGEGFQALDAVDVVNLICVPPDQPDGFAGAAVYAKAARYAQRRRAFVIVDAPPAWDARIEQGAVAEISPAEIGLSGDLARHAATYVPRVRAADPLASGAVRAFPVSGLIAGVYARTDATRGVWKAPAGVEASLTGAAGLTCALTDADNRVLSAQGINGLRTFPAVGSVVWGARTLAGADGLGEDARYVPVRRTALYIAESLQRGTQWAAFEPNAEPTWARLRQAVTAFMDGLFRQGALQGSSAKDAYFVRCDGTTTTQADVDAGVVNIVVGFAPMRPAAFIEILVQQAPLAPG